MPVQSTSSGDRLTVVAGLGDPAALQIPPTGEYRGRRRREPDVDLTEPVVLPPAQPTPPRTQASATPPSANVRRAPRHRDVGPVRAAGPRRRGLGTAAALAAVGAAAGIAALTGALPEQAPAQASAAMGPKSAHAVGAVAAGGARPSSEQESSSAIAGMEPEGAFRMVGVSRSQERGPIDGCDGVRPAKHYANGELPSSILCDLPFAGGHRLRADAAVRLIRLNEVYKGVFGADLCLTDSYRSLGSQYSLAARKPGLAARPGTSEHGWGLAIDVCGGPDKPGNSRRTWLLKHAPDFGWDNPAWARPGGSKPEPWHWEFIEGE